MLLEYHRRERRSRTVGLDVDVAGALAMQTGQDTQQGRLAAAARADDAEELAGVGLERDPIERHDRAAAALECHADFVDEDFGCVRGQDYILTAGRLTTWTSRSTFSR